MTSTAMIERKYCVCVLFFRAVFKTAYQTFIYIFDKIQEYFRIVED